MAHWEAIARERRALADVLDTLGADQWRAPSLCGAWTAHGVAAHLVTPLTFGWADVVPAVRSGGRVSVAMEALAQRRQHLSPGELVAVLRSRADRRVAPPGLGSAAPLTEVMVHGLDILVPLGIPDERPADPWRPVLDFALSRRARVGFVPVRPPRLRYVATDLDWSHGDGPEVTGPAAALGLALLRRTARVGELAGSGADSLRAWAAA